MAFRDVFEDTKRKLSSYFGIGQKGLGTFGQQIGNATQGAAQFMRQNPSPFRYAQRQLQPTVNFFKQNSSPASYVARNVVPKVKQEVRNTGRVIGNRFRTNYNTITPIARTGVDLLRRRAENTSLNEAPLANVADFGVQALQGIARSGVSGYLAGKNYYKNGIPKSQNLSQARQRWNEALNSNETYTPKGELAKLILKPYDVATPGQRGTQGLKNIGISEEKAKKYGPLVGIAATAGDLIPGIPGKKKIAQEGAEVLTEQGIKKVVPALAKISKLDEVKNTLKGLNVSDDIARKIAKSTKADEIAGYLRGIGNTEVRIPIRGRSEGKVETPKTVRVWNKSKFSDRGAYADIPVIRKEENITLYQGGKDGDGRQFWTPNKKYASQFGEVKEKTGTFYKVDNGNRMTDVYVEAKLSPLSTEGASGLLDDNIPLLESGLQTATTRAEAKRLFRQGRLKDVNIRLKPNEKPLIFSETGESKTIIPRVLGGEKSVKVKLNVLDDIAPESINDISGLDASFKDIYRNLQKAFRSKFNDVKRRVLDPFDYSKGAMIDEQVALTDNLKQKVIRGLGIGRNTKESALVQQFGEGRITLEQLKQQTPKWRAVVEADKFFRAEYNRLLDELNAVRAKIYPNDPDKIIPKRQDYYRHFRELEGLEELKNIFEGSSNIPTKLAGVSDVAQPRSKWLSLAQRRLEGRKFEDDAVGGYLDYIRASTYSKHIDPHIAKFRDLANEIKTKAGESNTGSRLAEYITDFANDLAGKTNPLDRSLQKLTGRKIFQGIDWLNKRVKLNVILANISAAVAQAGNAPQMMSKAGYRNYAMGIKDAIAGIGRKGKAIEASPFIKEKYTDAFSQFDTGMMASTKKFAGWITRALDEATTKAGWHAFYRQANQKGIKNAVKYADDLTREMVAGRGIGEVPLIQKSKVFQMIAPFQVEVTNLWHVLGKQMGEKKFGELLKFAVAAYGFNRAAEAIRGNGVVFDPIEAVADAIGAYQEEDDKKIGAVRAGGRLAGEVLSNIPLGQTIASLYPEYGVKVGDENLTRKELFGREDPTRFGSGLLAARGLQDPLYKILPAFGGQQIKRTIEGVQSYLKGSSETGSGRTRFPIDKNITNALKTATLGEYSTKEAREYFDKGRSALGENQSEIFNLGGGRDYYNKVMSDREAEAAAKKEIKAAKSDNKSPTASAAGTSDLGDDLIPLSNGNIYSKKLDKSFDTQVEAERAVAKDDLRKSGKNFMRVGDNVYRLSKGGDVTVEPKLSYDKKLTTEKLQNAKTAKDLKTWMDLAEQQEKNLVALLEDPTLDELDKITLQQELDKLLTDAAKYASYGGFTKGRSKKATLSVPQTSTLRTKIPIRAAKRPTFGRIPIISSRSGQLPLKNISKDYLSKLR